MRIIAKNEIGYGDPSTVHTGTPTAGVRPAAVAEVRVTHNGNSLTVSWDAPARAASYDVTYYNTTDGVNARAAWNRADNSDSPTLTITCDSRSGQENQNCVESGDTYTVGVRARNTAGESEWVNSGPATYSVGS